MKKIINTIKPFGKWRLPVAIISGIFFGLLFYLFFVSNAVSYLSDNPETCINCHIMVPQYATWSHSAHREQTNCNECHVPQDNFFRKYAFKAKDGIRHATIFTLRTEPQVIKIKPAGKKVVEQNCKRCHNYLNSNIQLFEKQHQQVNDVGHVKCWDCHRYTPHGRVNSLSVVPFARTPANEKIVPEWINKTIQKNKK